MQDEGDPGADHAGGGDRYQGPPVPFCIPSQIMCLPPLCIADHQEQTPKAASGAEDDTPNGTLDDTLAGREAAGGAAEGACRTIDLDNASHSERSAALGFQNQHLSFGCIMDPSLVRTISKRERRTRRNGAHSSPEMTHVYCVRPTGGPV